MNARKIEHNIHSHMKIFIMQLLHTKQKTAQNSQFFFFSHRSSFRSLLFYLISYRVYDQVTEALQVSSRNIFFSPFPIQSVQQFNMKSVYDRAWRVKDMKFLVLLNFYKV
jgi:hypothetical protein